MIFKTLNDQQVKEEIREYMKRFLGEKKENTSYQKYGTQKKISIKRKFIAMQAFIEARKNTHKYSTSLNSQENKTNGAKSQQMEGII